MRSPFLPEEGYIATPTIGCGLKDKDNYPDLLPRVLPAPMVGFFIIGSPFGRAPAIAGERAFENIHPLRHSFVVPPLPRGEALGNMTFDFLIYVLLIYYF